MQDRSILLAEDNADLRNLYSYLLRADGFEVTAVGDGEEALDELSRKKPDAVVTDLNMPHMDGLELIQWIRNQKDMVGLPVIAMTAYTDSMMSRAEVAGATKVIPKPNDNLLCSEINQVLEGRRLLTGKAS
jgi:CheY-like chemotaxis protein